MFSADDGISEVASSNNMNFEELIVKE